MKLRHGPSYICSYLWTYFWRILSRVANRQKVIWEIEHRVMEMNLKREAARKCPYTSILTLS